MSSVTLDSDTVPERGERIEEGGCGLRVLFPHLPDQSGSWRGCGAPWWPQPTRPQSRTWRYGLRSPRGLGRWRLQVACWAPWQCSEEPGLQEGEERARPLPFPCHRHSVAFLQVFMASQGDSGNTCQINSDPRVCFSLLDGSVLQAVHAPCSPQFLTSRDAAYRAPDWSPETRFPGPG